MKYLSDKLIFLLGAIFGLLKTTNYISEIKYALQTLKIN